MQVTSSASALRPLALRYLLKPVGTVGRGAAVAHGLQSRSVQGWKCLQANQTRRGIWEVPQRRRSLDLRRSAAFSCFRHTAVASQTSQVPNAGPTSGVPTLSQRFYTAESLLDIGVRKKVDLITEKFFEARELLDDARAAVDTIYFDSDLKEAQEAVTEALELYEELLESLSLEQREGVIRTIGLKMEELRAQQTMIEDSLHH